MLRNSFFLILVLMPVMFFCQPGYMGKKTALGGGISVNPAIFGSSANNKSLLGNEHGTSEIGHFTLNLTYDVFVERVIAKKWLFGTSIKYIHTGYDNREKSVEGELEGYYKINAITINPYFKCFARRTPAPLGRYFTIGPSLNLISTKHDNYMYLLEQTPTGHDTLNTEFGPKKQMHYSADLILGFGKTRIFGDKILIDYGFNVGVISAVYFVEALDPALIFGTPPKDNYIKLTSKSRVRNASRFNVFFRVAYLF